MIVLVNEATGYIDRNIRFSMKNLIKNLKTVNHVTGIGNAVKGLTVELITIE